MNNTYKLIYILELNDAQVLNLVNYFFNESFTRLDSIEKYMHKENIWFSNASNIKEALQLYLNESNKPEKDYYLFDGNSYVWDEKEYTLEKEEDEADYTKIKLHLFNNESSRCYVYSSLGRIVYETPIYDGLSCVRCEKHRIGIQEYINQLKENIKTLEDLYEH